MRIFYFFIALALIPPIFADTSKKIFIAKDLITLDDRFHDANAFVIEDERILSVGYFKDILKIYPNAQVDETFKDDVIVPGFIEHHIHPLLAAITMNSSIIAIDDWAIPGQSSKGVRERKGYLDRLIETERLNGDVKNPLISWGFHHYFHGELDRDDLDLISNHFFGSLDGQLIALGRVYKELDTVYIGRIAVKSKYRKNGYARKLMAFILKEVKTFHILI